MKYKKYYVGSPFFSLNQNSKARKTCTLCLFSPLYFFLNVFPVSLNSWAGQMFAGINKGDRERNIVVYGVLHYL
jgi:hypothetical protein